MTTPPRLTEVPAPGTPAALAQREQDLADVRAHGFSRLPAAQQRRLMETLPPEQITDVLAASPKPGKGDVVGVNSPKFPGRWIVEKRNPATVLLAPEGGGRGLKAHYGLICAAPEAGAEVPATIGQPYVPLTHFDCGSFVRYSGTQSVAGITPGALAVVLVDKGSAVNIAKLGGNGDRYMICKHRENLTAASLAEVAEALIAGL